MSKDAAFTAAAKGNQPSHQTGRANCDHCADWCSGCAMLYPGMEPHGNAYVQWMPGHCPYCAERERAAAKLEKRAAEIASGPWRYPFSPYLHNELAGWVRELAAELRAGAL